MRKERFSNVETGRGRVYPPGVSVDGKNTNVTISVSDGLNVTFLIYEKNGDEPVLELQMKQEYAVGSVYTLSIKNLDIRKFSYNFRVDGKIIPDPYARKIYGRERFGIRKEGQIIRCGYVELEDVMLRNEPRPFDEVIGYHLHVRGFTKKAQVDNRGTFAGLVEMISYFKELGINLIQMMPCYEFDETNTEIPQKKNPFIRDDAKEKKINFWGYGAGSYFAPKASYAKGKEPSREFLDFINAFHKAGIEVVMELYFDSSVSMRFMEEVLLFWMMKYGVDGFYVHCDYNARRFLAGQPLLAKSKLMFEEYSTDENYYDKLEKSGGWKTVGVANTGFQSDIRCFLKGDFGKTGQAVQRINANEIDCAIVNYITSHNGFTLADLVSYDYKHNEANGEENRDGSFENFSWNCGVEGKTRKKKILSLRLRMMKNALVLLLLSQGTPMLYGGDELANSQEGNNNAYCQDNEIGWVSWNTPKHYEELYGFVRKLIQFRKMNPVFHQKLPLRMMDTLACGYPDLSCHGENPWCENFETERQAIGMMYCGDYVAQPDGTYYVAYNMHWEEHTFALPKTMKKRQWYRTLDTSKTSDEAILEREEEELLVEQTKVELAPRSICVFHAK